MKSFGVLVMLALAGCGHDAHDAPAAAPLPTQSHAPSPDAYALPDVEPGTMSPRKLLGAYQAFLSGRGDDARRAFRDLALDAHASLRPLDLDDWSSIRASASGRFVLVETARCQFKTSTGAASRHCGDLLVDVVTKKILRYMPVEAFAFDKANAFFVGDLLVAWKSAAERVLLKLPELRETDVVKGEPVALLPDSTHVVMAVLTSAPQAADARAIFELRDLTSHQDTLRLVPRGPGPIGADSVMENTPLRVVRAGAVLVALVSGEFVGFDLVRGARLFSLATDEHDRSMALSQDERFASFNDVCDWSARRDPVPIGDGVDKAARKRTSVCPTSLDARVDLTTGAVDWRPHDPHASAGQAIGSARARAPLHFDPHTRSMFCAAGEIIVPSDVCTASDSSP